MIRHGFGLRSRYVALTVWSAASRLPDQRLQGVEMPNPGQPTISAGATGGAVRRLQRALRRTPNLGLVVDGVFGPSTDAAVKEFQQGAGLTVDGIVGPLTWNALPDGGPMPSSPTALPDSGTPHHKASTASSGPIRKRR